MFFAHSDDLLDQSNWQTLEQHLLAVAELAAEFGRPLGVEKAAYVAGLFHDLGKYTSAFQRRLAGSGERVDHSTAGARMLVDMTAGHDHGVAEIIAYAILGHHAGLPDRSNETQACYDERMKKPQDLDPVWLEELKPNVAGLVPGLVSRLPESTEGKAFALAFMGRMIFSCLVDADFKDTEAYYASTGQIKADRTWAPLAELLTSFIARYDAHMASFKGDGDLNRLRKDILSHVRKGAEREPGLFTLTVPTGGGKTLASLGFALDHASTHGHRRIIYAIPFTSIIDQTATVFRDLLGEEHVLEHHSALEEESFDPAKREQRDKLKLAMEDWAAPVVVTTTVQLFESLFAARTSKARKLHNIANSIIILDEAQTLPKNLLLPVMRAIEELAARYGCTVVLCTATQPALGLRKDFPGLPLEGRELAPDPKALATRLARTHIRHGGEMNNAALIAALESRDQALVIVNSRRHALELFREGTKAGLDGLVHLTTRHHATDRKRIMEDVRARLKDGSPCRLIATSLIEAGVDVDFPTAFRAEAGLDQIIQAAGRVNREGLRDRDASIVTVFKAPDYKPPREIEGLIGDMKRIIGKHGDLTSLAAIQDYFQEVYWRMGSGLDVKAILQKFMLSKSGTHFAYRKVADDFRMIDSGMAPVIVPTDAFSKKAVDQLRIEAISSGRLARELQGYVVQVPPKARAALVNNGHAAFEAQSQRGDQFAVLKKMEFYKEDTGLVWEKADELALHDMLI